MVNLNQTAYKMYQEYIEYLHGDSFPEEWNDEHRHNIATEWVMEDISHKVKYILDEVYDEAKGV